MVIRSERLIVAEADWDLRFECQWILAVFPIATAAQIMFATVINIFADVWALSIFQALSLIHI